MNITVPPILIPLALFALIVLTKVWVAPVLVQINRRNTGAGRKQTFIELVCVPCIACALVALALHLAGDDALLFRISSGLTWCVRGLIWDVLHPFAYGFSISF